MVGPGFGVRAPSFRDRKSCHETKEGNMGRPPIGKRAMTDAERQRRRRKRLGTGWPVLLNRCPWENGTLTNRTESKLIDRLNPWLTYGDAREVGTWLGFYMDDRERLDKIYARACEVIENQTGE